jgi:hypothetical protein
MVLVLWLQTPLKGSVCEAVRSGLRSYSDVCDAVYLLEIGLRLLGKTGGQPGGPLMTYLTEALKIGPQISSSVAKVGRPHHHHLHLHHHHEWSFCFII